MKKILTVLVIGLLVLGLSFLSKSKTGIKTGADVDLIFTEEFSPEDKSCTDAGCHADVIDNEVVHAAADDNGCDNCHKSNGNEHPKKNVNGFTMKESVPQVCFVCHDENSSKKNVHPPVAKGECMTCHTPHSAPSWYLLNSYPSSTLCEKCHDIDLLVTKPVIHKPISDGLCHKCHDPHESDRELLLKKDRPAMCIRCHKNHKKLLKLENKHGPYNDDCLKCHEVHSSLFEGMLDENVQNLCYGCHEGMKNKIESTTLVHKAVSEEKSCVNCHNPHASTEPSFLLANEKEVCLKCHNKVIISEEREIANIQKLVDNSDFVHKPIKTDGCIICHKPHASNNPFLLKSKFPTGRYAPAVADNFGICFECHESYLFEKETTTTATNFRNDEQNLHTVHINGEKGRNCNICHNVHAGARPHLIANVVSFGEWEMPVNYTSSEDGGSCNPGCHSEKSYKR